MQTRATVVGLLWALAFALAFALACSHDPVAVIHTDKGPVRVTLEVVADDASRTRGLMYRTELADGRGMLFVFDDEVDHAFWMKNTVIPLDIIFISADRRIVGIHPNAVPMNLARISVGRPSKYVLEVAGGYAARTGITPNHKIDFERLP
jgi:uncharacterized membrane protein (UPF0127 family)